jgi:uncharacterized protein (DUF1810 family)
MPVDLARFVDAQAPVYETALGELRRGRKQGHWMWFIFPQIAGLGASAMAQHYAISGREEARAYLDHPLLGGRLTECTQAMLTHGGARGATEILGGVDALKFRSSMTLFDAVSPDRASLSRQALDTFYGGEADARTLALLG